MLPLLVVMPLHTSFWAAHQPGLSRIYAVLEEVASQEGVDLIYPKGDYSSRRLFVDGHHFSHQGAAFFSANVAPALKQRARMASAPPAAQASSVEPLRIANNKQFFFDDFVIDSMDKLTRVLHWPERYLAIRS